ncbi:hypothetical protein Tco_1573391 [Tanacetum coccineum]
MISCTSKGIPLALPWGRTPRLDSGVRAAPIPEDEPPSAVPEDEPPSAVPEDEPPSAVPEDEPSSGHRPGTILVHLFRGG